MVVFADGVEEEEGWGEEEQEEMEGEEMRGFRRG